MENKLPLEEIFNAEYFNEPLDENTADDWAWEFVRRHPDYLNFYHEFYALNPYERFAFYILDKHRLGLPKTSFEEKDYSYTAKISGLDIDWDEMDEFGRTNMYLASLHKAGKIQIPLNIYLVHQLTKFRLRYYLDPSKTLREIEKIYGCPHSVFMWRSEIVQPDDVGNDSDTPLEDYEVVVKYDLRFSLKHQHEQILPSVKAYALSRIQEITEPYDACKDFSKYLMYREAINAGYTYEDISQYLYEEDFKQGGSRALDDIRKGVRQALEAGLNYALGDKLIERILLHRNGSLGEP